VAKVAYEKAIAALRAVALGYPETSEDSPWGHIAFKVRGKSFVFANVAEDELSVSCKLPASRDIALMLPYVEPTGYGLGKSGWVTARITGKTKVPVEMFASWFRESYAAIAPKKLVKLLGEES
jgi:predicted DNA-binding protein (MmcQ/YjbR family)